MNLQLSGKNIELTDALKTYVNDKIGGLTKYNEAITEIRVLLEDVREEHKEQFKATANVHVGHEVLYTEEVAADMYAAIDKMIDKLNKQVVKHKEKLKDHGNGHNDE